MIILVILQDENLRNKVTNLFQADTFNVIAVADSTAGIAVLKTRQIHLVITEVDIGKVDGWRLSRLIRSNVFVSDQDLPVILVTDNHCERIAETTACIFDINRVISYQDIDCIVDVANETLDKINNLNEPKKILVIEDTQDTANLVKRMLQHKYVIDIAENGVVGIQRFKEKNYDIVLLDMMMPGISGEEVLSLLMQLNPKQVVIIMTAHGTVDLAELMLVKGAADYIQKPFKAEQLRKVCDIAAKREDFIVSTEQFSAKAIALKSQQEKYESLSKHHYRILDNLTAIVIELNDKGRITFINNAWHKITGYLVSSTLGKPLTEFINHGSAQHIHFLNETCQNLLSEKIQQGSLELKLNKANDEYFWGEMHLSPFYDQDNKLVGVSGTIDDITVRKKAEKKLQHIAIHDNLTGMFNRYYFDELLQQTAVASARTGTVHALLYLDLDHFKIINDSQGHFQGDLVLKEVSQLLLSRKRESDVICRIGGDEFTLLLNQTNVDDAKIFAKDLCEAIASASFKFGEQTYKVSCSVGIAAIDGKAVSSDIYLQQADIAMFVAKERGRNRVHIYNTEDKLTDDVKQGFEWTQKIQQALTNDNIILHFQPVIHINTRQTHYYEALVRLTIDDTLIFPDKFIPSLEKSGGMKLLDRHVIGKAFSLMAQHPSLTKVAINLSAQAFSDDRLVTFIEEKLHKFHIEPARVIFELTESASLSNITATQRLVNRLNDLGCSFSIDDFGTGFSTFSYLKQIPAESVKIDGSFVKDMVNDKTDAALVKAINETAHALHKKTVAEFVEDEATLLMLSQLGIEYAQGYHIGRPMDILHVNNNLYVKK